MKFPLRRSLLIFGCVLGIHATGFTQASPFTVEVDPTIEVTVAAKPRADFSLTIRVPPDHYLYQDAAELTFTDLGDVVIESIAWPKAHEKIDSFTGIRKMVWEEDVTVSVTATAPAKGGVIPTQLRALLAYQGCSGELCFRRETVPVEWQFHLGAAAVPGAPNRSQTTDRPASHGFLEIVAAPAEHLFLHGMLLTYLLAWLGGLLTGFTPCVLPMLPVVLMIIGVTPDRRRRNFLLSSCLAAGLALTYALIGAIGVLAGQPIGFLFGQRWFLVLVVGFFLAMSASMFGLFHLHLPSRLQTRLNRVGGHGPLGAFLAGISTGLLATPCAGPVVAALVAHSSVQQDLVRGFTLLLTYGLGLGGLFVAVGTFSGHLTGSLARGTSMVWFKRLLGVLLLLPALYYAWALFDTQLPATPLVTALATAQQQQRPLLLEFTSKTCLPCIKLEKTTLQDPRIRDALATRIIPVRIDTTFLTPDNQALIARYQVVGWPTLLFLTPDGTALTDLSVVGQVIGVEALLARIAQAVERTHP